MNNSTIEKGKLLVVSGSSGAGKGTVLSELFKSYPDKYLYSISATTRAPRDEDIDGKTYFFISKDAFINGIENGDFLEYASYNDNFYGTPKKFVIDNLNSGKNVILEIDVQGALQIKKIFPEAIFVFITPESYEELEARLRGRNTETEEQIQKRLASARREAPYALLYDFIVVNKSGATKQAAEDINSAVRAFSMKPEFHHDVLNTFFGK